jgi:UTP--glucose-1-phosphate uridylyltransferase
MIRKAVIPAAGLGTRLLTVTKEQPKEMLPLFAYDLGKLCLKPVVQQIYEQLFDFGIRDFCFIVGKGKRAIEDHFTPDHEFIDRLNECGKEHNAIQLQYFYNRITESAIAWVNQPKPIGFGDAVLQAQRFVGDESFLVHAGDTYLFSKPRCIPASLAEIHAESQADATLALKEVSDPSKYGVAKVVGTADANLKVLEVVEKPSRPESKLAIMPVYIFNPTIFRALSNLPPGKAGEIQLTDGIQVLIDGGYEVRAFRLQPTDVQLDIGTPEDYWHALESSYAHASSSDW